MEVPYSEEQVFSQDDLMEKREINKKVIRSMTSSLRWVSRFLRILWTLMKVAITAFYKY